MVVVRRTVGRGSSLSRFDPATRGALDVLAGTIDTDAARRIWDSALATPAWTGGDVWVHGDLMPADLLVQHCHLTGVLDWGASVLSPPWLLVGASTVLATMFHPAGDPLRSFSAARLDRLMLALVGAAAVPLLAFAWTNIGLQRAGPTDHALLGHYGYMAALGFTVIGAGLLASARPDGWRLTMWVAGALPVVLGLSSLVYADVDSSLSLPWALAAVAWGVTFVAAAVFAGRGGRTHRDRTGRP